MQIYNFFPKTFIYFEKNIYLRIENDGIDIETIINMQQEAQHKHHITTGRGLLALSPMLVFVLFYLAGSIVAKDFYKVPVTVAFMVASIYGVLTSRGISLDQRIAAFSSGAGEHGLMTMIWIFIMAGAFAAAAKGMGSIDATVNLCMHLLPGKLMMAGLFIASCFISLSVGTSVGTIVALVPLAKGISEQTGTLLPMLVAIVVGGAYFGDNLSFISDTTIMATRTQGCRMGDKFRTNIRIVLPAAIISCIIYIIIGMDVTVPQQLPAIDFALVLPYLVVLITAIIGLDVMIVLLVGIVLCGIIGISNGNYDFYAFIGSMGSGIMGMSELIIVTLMAGGLIGLIRYNGGVQFIIERLTKHIHSKRGAEFTIGLLVFLTDLCTANNTIAILTVGPIARDITEQCNLDPRRTASILDTFSCMGQSIIPYGAQLLMASGLAAISAFWIIPWLFYPFLMAMCVFLNITFKKH